ncbi:hypothetical protein Tco_0505825 [Tanacetum coccineum]
MLTARKRVKPLPTYRPALRYTTDYSSSDHFTSNDITRILPRFFVWTSSDSHLDTSSDSSSRHSSSGYAISDSPCDSPIVVSARPSRKRCRSHTSSIPVASLVREALSPVRADLLPPRKRIRDSDFVTDLEVSSEEGYVSYIPRDIRLGVDIEDRLQSGRVRVGDLGYGQRRRSSYSAKSARSNMGLIDVTHQVVSDDMAEPVREDSPELVST